MSVHEFTTPAGAEAGGALVEVDEPTVGEFVLLERREEVVRVHQQDDEEAHDEEKLQTPVQTAELERDEAQHVRALARQGRVKG